MKKIQFFNHPEGYVSPVNASDISQGFKYVYQYKDHLGNVRLSYTDNDNNGVIDANTEIVEESNYYPFGLKHKGYNDVKNVGIGNPTAQKWGYQGVELNESLGLNLMEMDFRLYDPTIGRFNGIDPVTHYSQGTSVAFDNNPIYWADPSGADAEMPSLLQSLWDKTTGSATYYNDGNNNFTENKPNYITNSNRGELQTIADDLNSIYGKTYGATPFAVREIERTKTVQSGNFFSGYKYERVKYKTYILVGSIGFNWNTDDYTKMLYTILTSPEEITIGIIPDKGNGYHLPIRVEEGFTTNFRGFIDNYGGGLTVSPNKVYLSDALKSSAISGDWTIGGVFLHEFLRHISPNADPTEGVNVLRRYYNLRDDGGEHETGNNTNNKIKKVLLPSQKNKLIRIKG